MLGHWLFVRIRTAERALEEGRLDEAYAIAVQPDVRQHHRAQSLLTDLVRPLLARARLHLQAGRYREAVGDLDRIRAIGRGGPEIDTLREQVEREWGAEQQRLADQQQNLARAAAKLEAGRLESVRLVVERLEDSPDRRQLCGQLELRERRAGQLLEQAGEALGRGEVVAALRLWAEAIERQGRTREADEVAVRLAPAFRQTFGQWFAQGRLEQLLAARSALQALCGFDPTLVSLERTAALCERASVQLGRSDHVGLRETLLRLRAAQGAPEWLAEALAATTRIAEGQEALLASPLGALASGSGPAAPSPWAQAPPPGPGVDELRVRSAAGPGAVLGSEPLLVLVDGAGSSLLVSADCVRIGRAGSHRSVEVPIPADIQSHHADIRREGDDYFLIAHGPVRVNRSPVRHALLRDGDRVVLGDRAKFVFCQPSRRSASAVLRLSHRCRLEQDVSEVILFHETCLLGSQAACHLRVAEADCQVVLFEQAGRLYGRQATAGGGKLGDAKPLVPGQTLEFGSVRLTVKPYEVRTA